MSIHLAKSRWVRQNFLITTIIRSGVPFVKFSWETVLFTVHGQSEKNSDVTAWVFTSITGALLLTSMNVGTHSTVCKTKTNAPLVHALLTGLHCVVQN